jgi:hypothetical protein
MNQTEPPRRHAPATQRNREPILAILIEVLPPSGTVLEVASGTGEHAVFFAPRLRPRIWQPSDADPEALASIAAWRDHCPSDNLNSPLELDVQESRWPIEERRPNGVQLAGPAIAAIVSINLIHIAPWTACLGLLEGARRILNSGGILFLYGPFRRGDRHTAASNADFDAQLRLRNPQWGVRELGEVVDAAAQRGLKFERAYSMPANNFSLVFRA